MLQRDNTTPQRVIGEAINLSAPAVQRRIRRMETDGVIERNVAVVAPASLGRPLTIVALVQVESEQTSLIDDAKRSFAESPEVQQCYYVTGDMDFVLVITVRDMAEYEGLTRRIFFSNPNVKRFQTLVTMDRVKVGLSIPIGG